MYGAPVQPNPDLTGWKLVTDQAFYNGLALGFLAGACVVALAFVNFWVL